MFDLPPILGTDAVADLASAEEMVAGNPGGALDLAWPAFERGLFRLAGVAVSHWHAAGSPSSDALPIRHPDGRFIHALAIGHAVDLLSFCAEQAPLLPTQKLALPEVTRLRTGTDRVLAAIAGTTPERLRTTRFPLLDLVAAGAKPSRKGTAWLGAVGTFVRLRNLEAHHSGRAQEWVSGHPDYAAAFAPLVIPAMLDLLGHPEIAAPLRGWRVATVTDISRPRGGKPVLIALTPDDAEIQKAYVPGPGLDVRVSDQVVLDISAGATKGHIVMAFLDLATGVPAEIMQ